MTVRAAAAPPYPGLVAGVNFLMVTNQVDFQSLKNQILSCVPERLVTLVADEVRPLAGIYQAQSGAVHLLLPVGRNVLYHAIQAQTDFYD